VIEDDASTREAIEQLIAPAGYRVESFASAEAFLNAYRPQGPHVLLLDERLPGMSGSALLRQLHERGQSSPAILVTAYATTPMIVDAMRLGAVNVLDKPCSELQLRDSVRMGVEKSQRDYVGNLTQNRVNEQIAKLGQNEREVLQMVLDGVPNKHIAKQQNVCVRTVEARRSRVYKALGVTSVAELTRLCLQAGFIAE
jgi:FixJ family two-component response regulator